MSTERLSRQLAFLDELEKLKLVYRRNRTLDPSRCENSAEHSWHLALLALVLWEHADQPELDRFKVVQLLLIHDLVEIYAGDTWLYDSAGQADQAQRERASAATLFGLLPADQAQQFQALWDEFEARETPEAQFAAALDAFQPLTNYLLTGNPDNEPVPTEADVLERKQTIARGSQALWDVAQAVIAASTEKGLYRR